MCNFTVDCNQCIMAVPTESAVHNITICDRGIHCSLHYRLLPSSPRPTCTCEGLEKVFSRFIVIVGLNYTIVGG